jgi:hypothetical protein
LVQTNKSIKKGDSVLINYGKDFFNDNESCFCQSCRKKANLEFITPPLNSANQHSTASNHAEAQRRRKQRQKKKKQQCNELGIELNS